MLYKSESTLKSLWQKYEIHEDKVIFHTLLWNVTIPFGNVASIQSSGSNLKEFFKGTIKLKDLFIPTLKIDFSDFTEHVIIDKNEGLLKRIMFTPENPTEFIEELNSALHSYKERLNKSIK